MGAVNDHITAEQAALIEESHMFFIASADAALGDGPQGQGPVNLSPKGATPLRVINEHRVAYLDYGGSGNETARHAAGGGPVTVMVMSTSSDAGIVRLYGHARASTLESLDAELAVVWDGATAVGLAERQVIVIDVEHTQTSCGYGIPLLEFVKERDREQHGRRYKGRGD